MSVKRAACIELHHAGWCKNHFLCFWSKEVWPPSSPDLNPTNFCVWFILKADACASSHDSVKALKGSLKKAWDQIPQETLRKALHSFRCRLERGSILNKTF